MSDMNIQQADIAIVGGGIGIATGAALGERWLPIALGIVLAGPLLCGTSQAVNDWFDRHVDAINEPHRPIPSGRMPGRWGLVIACLWTGLSLLWAVPLGTWGFLAAALATSAASLSEDTKTTPPFGPSEARAAVARCSGRAAS